MHERLAQVKQVMAEEGVSNQIISNPYAINYFTGYWNEPGERLYLLLVKQEGPAYLVLNRLFAPPTFEEDGAIEILWYNDGEDVLEAVISKLAEGPTGIDKYWPSQFLLYLLDHAPNFKPVNNSSMIDDLRAIKSADEQVIMKEASKFNDEAMKRIIQEIDGQKNEAELVNRLREIYADLGQDGFSFEPIIAFGANGADPHHTTNHDTPKKGDSVVIDIGAMHKGYASDMTRTVFYGEPSEEARTVYETVLKANKEAIKHVKAGVPYSTIDQVARSIIEEAGYGPYFTHRTGHFIGQEVHEAGDVSAFNHEVIQAGHVFSIEPGIYLPGKLGVRIEDLIIATEDGCEVINHFPKDLIVIEPQN